MSAPPPPQTPAQRDWVDFRVDFTKTVDGLPDAQARWEYAQFLGAPCEGAAFRELCRLYKVARYTHEKKQRNHDTPSSSAVPVRTSRTLVQQTLRWPTVPPTAPRATEAAPRATED